MPPQGPHEQESHGVSTLCDNDECALVLGDADAGLACARQVHGSKLEAAMAWLLQGNAETLEEATVIISTAGMSTVFRAGWVAFRLLLSS